MKKIIPATMQEWDFHGFHGLSESIRSIRENPRFLLVAETMINAQRFFNARTKNYVLSNFQDETEKLKLGAIRNVFRNSARGTG